MIAELIYVILNRTICWKTKMKLWTDTKGRIIWKEDRQHLRKFPIFLKHGRASDAELTHSCCIIFIRIFCNFDLTKVKKKMLLRKRIVKEMKRNHFLTYKPAPQEMVCQQSQPSAHLLRDLILPWQTMTTKPPPKMRIFVEIICCLLCNNKQTTYLSHAISFQKAMTSDGFPFLHDRKRESRGARHLEKALRILSCDHSFDC